MILSMIAAMSENRVIGKDNTLPRDYPDDIKRFRAITYGSTIIMGRRTYESLGKPLPGRRNIVLSKNSEFPEVEHYDSPENLIAMLEQELGDEDQVFIIGGGSLYKYFLSQAEYIYMTHIYEIVNGDTYFPAFEEHYDEIERTSPTEKYDFITYRKKRVE